jgi:hypothetical protein
MPSFLQIVLMSRHFEIYDGKAPVWLQKAAGVLLAPLALALGYRAEYAGADERERASLPRAVATGA